MDREDFNIVLINILYRPQVFTSFPNTISQNLKYHSVHIAQNPSLRSRKPDGQRSSCWRSIRFRLI